MPKAGRRMDPADGRRIDSPHHYFTSEYCAPARLAAYGYQIAEVLDARPSRVLEVGPGNGVVSHVLRGAGLEVVTLDLDARVGPDLVGSVTHLPFVARVFDVVLCCEVLEHLPYCVFQPALLEMRRVSRRYVLLSLPDSGRHCKLHVVLPLLGEWQVLHSLPRLRAPRHSFDGQHHWEIGKEGYSRRRVVADMRHAGCQLLRDYRVWEQPYHHMFVLDGRHDVLSRKVSGQ